jgi:hypothetical protein
MRSQRSPWLAVAVLPAVIGAAAVGALISRASFATPTIIVLALAGHGLLLLWARRLAGRWLSILVGVCVLWIAYFPIRTATVLANRHNPTLHPVVAAASDAAHLRVLIVSLASMGALLVGAMLADKTRAARAAPVTVASRSTYAGITVAGLAITVALKVGGLQSGVIDNAGHVFLFGLAAIGFTEARSRFRLSTLLLIASACALGVLASFKELAVLPVAAWSIGAIAGRRGRVRIRVVVATLAAALIGYVGVSGQRIAATNNHPRTFFGAVADAVTKDDLRTGSPGYRRKSAPEMVTNVLSGFSKRFAGADSLLVIESHVPSDVRFQGGRSILLPILTVIPRVPLPAGTDYNTLSLGRYFNVTFYSLHPATDPSSQAITMLGDLYLNFGNAACVVGMLLFGIGLMLFDRRYPLTNAFNAGAFGYVGTAILGIERNVGYQIVTVGIRLAIVAVLAFVLSTADRRSATLPEENTIDSLAT